MARKDALGTHSDREQAARPRVSSKMNERRKRFLPIHVRTAEHYMWGDACHGWHLVKDAALSVIEEEMPPQASEVCHFHRRSQQFFYVLGGEAELEIEGCRLRLGQGEGSLVPPGVRHQMKNASSAPVRFLVISAPPSHGDRVPCTEPRAGLRSTNKAR